MGSDSFSDSGSQIPPQIETKLIKQGWHPEWDYDVDSCERKLNKNGIQLVDAARFFLEKFGGLSILGSASCRRYYLNPIRVLRYVPAEKILAYETEIQQPFSPIGEVDGGQMDILLDAEQGFYLVRDDTVVKVANSYGSALQYFLK